MCCAYHLSVYCSIWCHCPFSADEKDHFLQTSDLDLKELVNVLRRQRRLILLTLLTTLALALIYLSLATPVFRASALLSIEAGGSNLLDPNAVESSQSAVLNSRVDGEAEILRSAAMVLAVVDSAGLMTDPEFGPRLGLAEKLGLALGLDGSGDRLRALLGLPPHPAPSHEELVAEAIGRLEQAVEVRRRGLTYLISVSVDAEDPARAARIANAYAATYIARQVAAKAAAAIAARDVLRRQIGTARTALAASETALNGFIDENLGRLEADSDNQAIAALRDQLESTRARRIEGSALLATAETAAAQKDWEAAARSLGDVALAELARQRADLLRRLGEEEDGSQAALQLAAELDRLDQGLTTRLTEARATAEGDLQAIGDTEERARTQLREALLQSDQSSDMLAELFNLQQTASVARGQYQQLLTRAQDLDALAHLQIADARVVSEALPPLDPASPNRRLILALALLSGLGAGVFLALMQEYYIGGVTSAGQLRNLLQAPVPVTIPALAASGAAAHPADTVTRAPMSVFAESFRKLRSAIDTTLRGRPAGRGAVVLVSSALPGEGKTTTSLALARTYAQSGLRTLLIDCDLRKPAVAEAILAEAPMGLLDYLCQDFGPDGPEIQPLKDPLSDLMVITAGGRSSQPTDQLVGSERLHALLQAAAEAFDLVLLDSPPVLPVVDARYLAQSADLVVQVVHFAGTTQGEVREAAQQLQEVCRPGVPLLGLLCRQDLRATRRGGAYRGYQGYFSEGAG